MTSRMNIIKTISTSTRVSVNVQNHNAMGQFSFFLCLTACLVASSMALTQREALRVIGENKGKTIGGTKMQLAMLMQAALAVGTPQEKLCVGSKARELFVGSKLNILTAIRAITDTTIQNWEQVQAKDVESFRQVVTEQCAKIQSDIVNNAKTELQTCMS